jgi:hypothetical protein
VVFRLSLCHGPPALAALPLLPARPSPAGGNRYFQQEFKSGLQGVAAHGGARRARLRWCQKLAADPMFDMAQPGSV